jgi:hypothetical protein
MHPHTVPVFPQFAVPNNNVVSHSLQTTWTSPMHLLLRSLLGETVSSFSMENLLEFFQTGWSFWCSGICHGEWRDPALMFFDPLNCYFIICSNKMSPDSSDHVDRWNQSSQSMKLTTHLQIGLIWECVDLLVYGLHACLYSQNCLSTF